MHTPAEAKYSQIVLAGCKPAFEALGLWLLNVLATVNLPRQHCKIQHIVPCPDRHVQQAVLGISRRAHLHSTPKEATIAYCYAVHILDLQGVHQVQGGGEGSSDHSDLRPLKCCAIGRPQVV